MDRAFEALVEVCVKLPFVMLQACMEHEKTEELRKTPYISGNPEQDIAVMERAMNQKRNLDDRA